MNINYSYLCGKAGAPMLFGSQGVFDGMSKCLASGIVNNLGLSTAQYIQLTNTEVYGAIYRRNYVKSMKF